ncbi:uncharacterized protein LOC123509688 [Portunus trituberculatus]|uniref:uncharacterized protein LOC123509688 n=1 Tax=Portunus trituberculatus TaxID=210409 RepID=UPI001E1CF58C|nr:uncharacterized protein LOC123509688 [Portunus trituberculatus]
MPPLLLAFLLLAGSTDATGGGWGWRGHTFNWEPKDEAVEPFCYPYNYTCGPIAPSPPTSYEAHLEHVDLVHKTTHYIEEFYDYENNLLAVTDAFGNSLLHAIFYFDINAAVLMSTDREMGPSEHHPTICSVAEISHSSVFHPFPGVNGTAHLVFAPSQAMLFGNNYRYAYVDNGTARSMEYNRWDACISTQTESFNIEYYWTDPELVNDMNGYTSERPIKMRMTGHAQPPPGTSEMVQIDSVYSVALFDANPDLKNLRWAFEIPSGVYCQDFPSVKSPPSTLAHAFSMRVELSWRGDSDMFGKYERGDEFMMTFRTWYDFYNQLTRVDSMTQLATPEFSVAGLTQVAVISDFRAGVEYIIDKTLGNCTTMNLTDNGYSFTSPDGHHSISDPLHVFGIEGGPNLTYQGMKYARGLPCDVWVGQESSQDGTFHNSYLYELYFLQAGWMEDTGNQVKSLPVPVLIKVHNVYGDETMTVYLDLQENIFKFEENDPSMSVFDITPCFTGHDHIRRFQMAFSSDYRDDFDRDPALFTQEITDSLLVYLRIPFLRLQHPLVEYVKDFNHLFYEFTLLDQPQVDMEMPQYVGKPLAEVVEELKLSMYTLVIVIIDEQGHPKKMKPIANSLRELFEDGCYSRDTSYPPFHDLQNPRPVTDVPRVTSNDWIEKTTTEERKEDEVKGSVFTFLMEMQQWVRSSSDEETYYTPGDMAGMAVGMLLLGLLLGTVVMLVILRKMGLSNDLEYIPMNSRRN